MYNTNINDLLKWYELNKREMPWRNTKNPYKIWLSEIMLQQTQVNTVIPYYNKWISAFPTLKHVAEAKEDLLLKHWEGLGYYRRCRNFYNAAKTVVNNYDGTLPPNVKSMIALPGIGEYTASALLSISFNQPIPVIDANVKRVMARVLKIRYFTVRNRFRLKNVLSSWINDTKTPGNFNQAMMELGSQICTPKNPKCFACPISDNCAGFKSGSPERYPAAISVKKIPTYDVSVGIIWNKDKFYIQRRDKKMHLGGLWELPGGKPRNNENCQNAVAREIKEECNAGVDVKSQAGFVKHQYSHFKIELTAFHCSLQKGYSIPITTSSKWITPSEIGSFPFPKATLKIFEQALPC